MNWTKKLSDSQREQVEALIFELGLVPADLITPSIVSSIHSELYTQSLEQNLSSIQKEASDEFLATSLSHWRHYRRERNLDNSFFTQLEINF